MKRLEYLGGLLVALSLVISTGCGTFCKKGCGSGCGTGACDETAAAGALSSKDIELTSYSETQQTLPTPRTNTTSQGGILRTSCKT